MKTTPKKLALIGLWLCLGCAPVVPQPQAPAAHLATTGRGALAVALPGFDLFIANVGQRESEGAYYAQGPGHMLDFGAHGVQMALAEATLHLDLLGAQAVQPVGEAPLTARINVFHGNDPAQWRTDIPTYAQLRYAELYADIDLVYTPGPELLKTTFYVKAGADVSQIQLRYRGAERLWVDETGALRIPFAGGELRESRPVAYQEIAGARVPVEARFDLRGPLTYGFAVAGDYDPRYPLVIDPDLDYGTYLGGSSAEGGNAIAMDARGFVYVVGGTGAGDFPTRNPYQGYQGYSDVVIVKLDPTQTGTASLVYATYLGGSAGDSAGGLVVDDVSNVFVAGFTQSDDFPTTPGAYDRTCGTDGTCNRQGSTLTFDAFLVKLNAAGNALLYGTYFGGSSSELIYSGLAAAGDQVYLAGYTFSTDLPVTPGVYDPISNGNADIFAARFDLGQPGAAALVYATYLGGSDSDFGYDLAVDSAGNAYIGGYTYSPDAPTHNAYQSVPANSGYTDAYIAKLDPSGSTLLYATYLGGSGFDRGWQLAVDDLGNVYQTGETSSTDFSTRNAYQDARNGSRSAFLASIDTTQGGVASLLYATYLGGLGLDTGHGIAHAGGRRVYVTGWTTSPDFPVTPYAYDPTCGTDGHCNYDTYRRSDAFITEIDTSRSGAASLLQSTFLGGSRDDQGLAIALDADGGVYVTGMTESPDFPTTAGAYDHTCGTDGDCNPGAILPYASDIFVTLLRARVDLSTSRKTVHPALITSTQTLTHTLAYTLTLANSGELPADTVALTDTLPAVLALKQGPACTHGTCGYYAATHTITWTGALDPGQALTLTYTGHISVTGGATLFVRNSALVADGFGPPWTLTATSWVNPRRVYLPLVCRGH